jgi:hypothetical protein
MRMNTFGARVRRLWKRMDLVQPLIIGGALLLAGLAVPRARISALQPGERLVVQIKMQGCFGDSRERFTFTPEADGLRYTSFSPDWPAGHRTRTGILTPAQAARLDTEMDRFSPIRARGGCSRLTKATITRYLHGVPVSHGWFAHPWCAVRTSEMGLSRLLREVR